jgi:LysM repeat protein
MRLLTLIGVSIFSFHSFGFYKPENNSKKEYVDNWSDVAVEQMLEYKIPASITLAQGILESGSGSSRLAKEGNNHFGIKCHGWEGKTMYMDDDEKDECFRVYETAKESYVDHSKFLTGNKRYNILFTYAITDYVSWANGLKTAGYATSPKYADLLISLIEELNLSQYDKVVSPSLASFPFEIANLEEQNKLPHVVNVKNNKVKYIVAKTGDTYYRISKEFGIGLWQLYRYNDFQTSKDIIEEGDIIYIQPKRKWSKTKFIEIDKNMSIREFSQMEAFDLEKLMKINQITSPDEMLNKGEKVILR